MCMHFLWLEEISCGQNKSSAVGHVDVGMHQLHQNFNRLPSNRAHDNAFKLEYDCTPQVETTLSIRCTKH